MLVVNLIVGVCVVCGFMYILAEIFIGDDMRK